MNISLERAMAIVGRGASAQNSGELEDKKESIDDVAERKVEGQEKMKELRVEAENLQQEDMDDARWNEFIFHDQRRIGRAKTENVQAQKSVTTKASSADEELTNLRGEVQDVQATFAESKETVNDLMTELKRVQSAALV